MSGNKRQTWGASIKYVRTEGEGGGSKKSENMRTILTDRLREKRTRGGGRGAKKPENLRTYLMDAP